MDPILRGTISNKNCTCLVLIVLRAVKFFGSHPSHPFWYNPLMYIHQRYHGYKAIEYASCIRLLYICSDSGSRETLRVYITNEEIST